MKVNQSPKPETWFQAFWANYFGHYPDGKPVPNWYKLSVPFVLILNACLWYSGYEQTASYLVVFECLFFMFNAKTAFPLLAIVLLGFQASKLGMVTGHDIWHEITTPEALKVIFLVTTMVAAITFLEDFLTKIFLKIFLSIADKMLLSLTLLGAMTLLSAGLDALTIGAMLIGLLIIVYRIYHRAVSIVKDELYQIDSDEHITNDNLAVLEEFRSFLFSLVMHAFIGTALGGCMTMVGEPQNMAIVESVNQFIDWMNLKFGTHYAHWDFEAFFMKAQPVALPIAGAGALICILLESFPVIGVIFGHGYTMPEKVRTILKNHVDEEAEKLQNDPYKKRKKAKLITQALSLILLVAMLLTHMFEVALIGLIIMSIAGTFNGKNDEHDFGKAFKGHMGFVSILLGLFMIITVINVQDLTAPAKEWIADETTSMSMEQKVYVSSGIASTGSDNAFIGITFIQAISDMAKKSASEYKTIEELDQAAVDEHAINLEKFESLAIAVNMGTNIPSIATPNGQAAFLFLFMSMLQNLLGISFWRMFKAALPYTIILSLIGFFLI